MCKGKSLSNDTYFDLSNGVYSLRIDNRTFTLCLKMNVLKILYVEIFWNVKSLILQLKVYYQRARPFQVAFYSKQNFVPFESTSAHTPSYPSGHATQIYIIGLVEIFKNPQKEKEIKKFCNMVAKTREIMGVHFESDTNFGKIIATALSKHPKIKEIYFKK